MIVAASLVGTLAAAQPGARPSLDDPVPLVRWSGVPYRTAVERAAEGLGYGLVIDRRIDPSRHVDVVLRDTTNRGVLEALAEDAGGELRVVGKTLDIGPPSAAPLRTLIRLRTDEAIDRLGAKSNQVSRRWNFAWSNFSRPREILADMGEKYGVMIEGLEAIPHDLWAEAELADATFTEAASLVLIQFDRTFEWTDEGSARIVPIPKSIGIEKLHAPKGGTAQEVVAAWRKRFPEARIEVAGRRVRMFALLETHEAASAEPTDDTGDPPEPSPLDQQRFTLRVQGAPASALIKRLEQVGLVFEYDAAALAKAKVDLDARIEIDVEEATTDELLKAVFDPLNVEFTRSGGTVRLRPAEE